MTIKELREHLDDIHICDTDEVQFILFKQSKKQNEYIKLKLDDMFTEVRFCCENEVTIKLIIGGNE